MRNCDELCTKWLIRILLKQMKIGIGEKVVLHEFHPDASRLFDVTTSLTAVCTKLADRSRTMDEVEIELFQPFRPMLADRVTITDVPAVMRQSEFYVETKYDGERVQVHKMGDKYMYFSRKLVPFIAVAHFSGNDNTGIFGGDAQSGTLTKHIHPLLDSSITSCILDGELVGWNAQTETYGRCPLAYSHLHSLCSNERRRRLRRQVLQRR